MAKTKRDPSKATKKRQRQTTRKALILTALLLFPITMNYLSPYLIVDGAFQGIINGSFILFALMFVSALFVGRLWCGWLCPAAGLGEACFMINDKPARGGRFNWIKWGIWLPWIGIIAYGALSAGGYTRINVLHMTETGISMDEPAKFIIYYIVVGTIFALSLTAGRRAFCHYGCWMAPFMILGRKVRNLGKWASLRLVAERSQCIDCQICTRNCPMSLDVNGMVRQMDMENSECILCGNCVDSCPKGAIRFSFSSSR